MKVKINSKKNLKVNLSILVDKKTIQKKMDDKLIELKDKVQLKGFRPGKVPPQVIKNQFGKAIYGEVIDGLLKETSTKALEENKIKVAGQPKIDLKTFGEGKDLDYTMEVDILPDIKLKPLDKIMPYRLEMGTKINGYWRWSSRETLLNNVFYCRELLKQENIRQGDRVAYKGGNSIEWISWNIACNSLGGVWVPMYANQNLSLIHI